MASTAALAAALLLASLCSASLSPLFLTPYLQAGRLAQAQRDSRVGRLNGSCVLGGHAAFLTVNARHNTNLFFWFMPADTGSESAPLLLWLDGGPGTTSMTGVFVLTGPYVVDGQRRVSMRPERWTRRYNMLYVDSPAGVGFSFTRAQAGYAHSEADVARDLYALLVQFVQIFHQYRASPLYLGGLSYAGKYVPALGYRIHTENPTAHVHLNLQGIYIGGPFTDPKTILPTYASHLYNTGLLSWNQSQEMEVGLAKTLALMTRGEFKAAFDLFQSLYLGSGFLWRSSGYMVHSNILQSFSPPSQAYFQTFVSAQDVRSALHAGRGPFNAFSSTVFDRLKPDFMRSARHWLATLMDHYKVLLYNGQLDMVVCPPSTQATLRALAWARQADYLAAPRRIWRLGPDDSDVAGYVTKVHNFTHVVVRQAGHMTPFDQPQRTWDMIQRFIENRPFF